MTSSTASISPLALLAPRCPRGPVRLSPIVSREHPYDLLVILCCTCEHHLPECRPRLARTAFLDVSSLNFGVALTGAAVFLAWLRDANVASRSSTVVASACSSTIPNRDATVMTLRPRKAGQLPIGAREARHYRSFACMPAQGRDGVSTRGHIYMTTQSARSCSTRRRDEPSGKSSNVPTAPQVGMYTPPHEGMTLTPCCRRGRATLSGAARAKRGGSLCNLDFAGVKAKLRRDREP
jgi:hypothetical protein